MPQQIGWSTEAKLLYQLKQQVARFGGGGGGGATVIEITLVDVLAAISAGTLTPGAVYKITGVHKDKVPPNPAPSLYNDGTNSGTTIYLEAVSATELSATGWGEFYNPKYKTFADYTNTDGTGLWGIYQSTVSYVVGDTTIWGGYVWSCIADSTGNTSLNDFTLDPTYWVKVPYSNTLVYDKVLDIIECDLANDYIVLRHDATVNNTASLTITQADWFGVEHAILGIPWGLNSNKVSISPDFWKGVNGVSVINAFVNVVNFKGQHFLNVSADKGAFIGYCTFGINTAFNNCVFTNWTYIAQTSIEAGNIDSCIFDFMQLSQATLNNFTAYNCKFLENCRFVFNVTIQNSVWDSCSFNAFGLQSVTLNGFQMYYSTFHSQSSGNTFGDCGIFNSPLVSGEIKSCDWRNSRITGFDMSFGFSMVDCKIHKSVFQNSTYTAANSRVFNSCEITNCTFNFTAASAAGGGGVTNTTNLKAYGVTVANASFAAINNTHYKQLVLNSGGTNTLSYFNGSNVLTNATF